MPYFVIVGKADCPNFTHVVYVARYLNEYLPNFHLSVRQKGVGDWEVILNFHKLQKKNVVANIFRNGLRK